MKLEKEYAYGMTLEGKKEPVGSFPIASKRIQELMPCLLNHITKHPLISEKLFQVEFQSTRNSEIMVSLIYHKKLDEIWYGRASEISSELGISIIGRSRKQRLIAESVFKYAGSTYKDIVALETIVEANGDTTDACKKSKVNLLGAIPENRTLLSLTVNEIAEILGAEFYSGQEYGDTLVENFMVGGFGMDPGQYVFNTKYKKAVIVRGDRPDVQMSALETPMSCFIMTNAIEPIEYVKYESEEEKVPILIVQENTLDTMNAVDKLTNYAQFNHPEKLEEAKTLIIENLKVEEIVTNFGQLSLM